MVALAIISISLVVLLHSQSSNIARAYESTSLTRAALLSQKILSEAGSGAAVSEGKWEGKEEMEGIIFYWKKMVEPTVVEGLMKITVSVSWGEEEGGAPYVVETYRIS